MLGFLFAWVHRVDSATENIFAGLSEFFHMEH